VSIAHFLTQRKAYIGLKTIAAIYILQGESMSGAVCLLFKTQALAAPVPRPQGEAAQSGQSGKDLSSPIAQSSEKRSEHKREIVREHTFRVVDGMVTYSSEYV
jgi:hypothetical protein